MDITTSEPLYTVVTPRQNYSGDVFQIVLWNSKLFMPFDIVKGARYFVMDSIQSTSKGGDRCESWAVLPRSYQVNSNGHLTTATVMNSAVSLTSVNSISTFIPDVPLAAEFETLIEAVNFCLNWRREWLLKELDKTYSMP